MSVDNPIKSKKASADSAVLGYILEQLEARIQDSLNIVSDSAALYDQIGEKSEFAKKLEAALDNPIDSFSENYERSDHMMTQLLDFLMRKKLRPFADSIRGAWKAKNTGRDLLYFIAIDEDDSDLENSLTDILVDYNKKGISDKFPVIFQIIPIQMKNDLFNVENVRLNG